MSWAIGYDSFWKRDIGYGVPAVCDHPRCDEAIDRGLPHVCGDEPYGGDRGCGLYFCADHRLWHERLPRLCERCSKRRAPFAAKPDVRKWIEHKLTDPSWNAWRQSSPLEVEELRAHFATLPPRRVQLSRARGWKMPPNTAKVDRSTRWGNPWTSENSGRVLPVLRFACETAPLMDLAPLRGKNLACWCQPDAECHADVLLELANAAPGDAERASQPHAQKKSEPFANPGFLPAKLVAKASES